MAQGQLDKLVRLKVIEVVGENGYAYVPKKKGKAPEGTARKGKPLKLGLRDWSWAVFPWRSHSAARASPAMS